MLIGSEVYSTVSYFRKTDPLAIVTTGACTVVTKINDLQIDLEWRGVSCFLTTSKVEITWDLHEKMWVCEKFLEKKFIQEKVNWLFKKIILEIKEMLSQKEILRYYEECVTEIDYDKHMEIMKERERDWDW